MSEYTFRLAQHSERDAITAFMRTHWDGRHPLVELPEYFAYYYATEKDHLNFALCEKEGELAALAGFTPAANAPGADVWVSLWVANPAYRGSGLELMAALPALCGARTIACNNIRPKTRAFYEFLGYSTGMLSHFYRLADKENYLLARLQQKDIPPATGGGNLVPLSSETALLESGFAPPQNANPQKDMWYLRRRFFHFPHHQYTLYAGHLPGGGAPVLLLATRTIAAAGTRVLRIADCIGPPTLLPRFGAAIEALRAAEGAEYADCYCAGVGAEVMRAAGFALRDSTSPNIIPNYLTPPLMENTDYYYFTNNAENFTMFKADGDQDRPNIPL